LTVPADADEFLNQLEEATGNSPDGEPLERDPYWARLWPTALTMARWVMSRRWRTGQPALEMGCGVGIVGLAGWLSGLRVTFSDRVALAVRVAVENAVRNGCGGAQGMVFDWARPCAGEYPTLLASDVLYDPRLHEPLLHSISRLLAAEGTCFIGDPGRFHVAGFVELCRRYGMAVVIRDVRGNRLVGPICGAFQLLTIRREAAGRRVR
jgi:predicted nicotinamide N-methyase